MQLQLIQLKNKRTQTKFIHLQINLILIANDSLSELNLTMMDIRIKKKLLCLIKFTN